MKIITPFILFSCLFTAYVTEGSKKSCKDSILKKYPKATCSTAPSEEECRKVCESQGEEQCKGTRGDIQKLVCTTEDKTDDNITCCCKITCESEEEVRERLYKDLEERRGDNITTKICTDATDKDTLKSSLKGLCNDKDEVYVARKYCLEETKGAFYCLKYGNCIGDNICGGCIVYECEVDGTKQKFDTPEEYMEEHLKAKDFDKDTAINVDEMNNTISERQWCTNVEERGECENICKDFGDKLCKASTALKYDTQDHCKRGGKDCECCCQPTCQALDVGAKEDTAEDKIEAKEEEESDSEQDGSGAKEESAAESEDSEKPKEEDAEEKEEDAKTESESEASGEETEGSGDEEEKGSGDGDDDEADSGDEAKSESGDGETDSGSGDEAKAEPAEDASEAKEGDEAEESDGDEPGSQSDGETGSGDDSKSEAGDSEADGNDELKAELGEEEESGSGAESEPSGDDESKSDGSGDGEAKDAEEAEEPSSGSGDDETEGEEAEAKTETEDADTADAADAEEAESSGEKSEAADDADKKEPAAAAAEEPASEAAKQRPVYDEIKVEPKEDAKGEIAIDSENTGTIKKNEEDEEDEEKEEQQHPLV